MAYILIVLLASKCGEGQANHNFDNLDLYIYSWSPCIYTVLLFQDQSTHQPLSPLPQTYGITVLHASKAEIGLLKNKGVVGGKAGRCALFSARAVCQMFHHWKTSPPPPLAELAEGKVSLYIMCELCFCMRKMCWYNNIILE